MKNQQVNEVKNSSDVATEHRATRDLNEVPTNCTVVNGYRVAKSETLVGDIFDTFDPVQNCWWGFNFHSFEAAERACNALAGN